MDKPKINLIDFYNQNFIDEAINIFLSKNKSVEKVAEGDYSCVVNKKDKTIHFHQNSIYLEVVEDNPLNLEKGLKISPFEILKRYKHKDEFYRAYGELENRFTKSDLPYIRVAGNYFKRIINIDRDGIERKELITWKKEAIIDDYGRPILQEIPKYDGFTLEPNNKDFQQVVNGMYNMYAPFAHKSKPYDLKKSDEKIKWSLEVIKHIWGDQWELGLIYMQVCYLYPKQILPILAPVSEERETGKTTLGDWMNMIYGDNSVVINPSNIGSNFTSSYGTKNIIIIEETKFDKSSDLEKIKALGTQKKILINQKHISEYSMPFYAKIIMFSNHEAKFVIIDEQENRYWVKKVPTLEGKANHNILKDLKDEIPYFLYFLEQMPEPDFSKSRMVFTLEQITTDILIETKKNSRSALHQTILDYLDDYGMNNTDREVLEFTNIDLYNKWFSKTKWDLSYIAKVLKYELKLEKAEMVIRYRGLDNPHDVKSEVGRPYSFVNEHYKKPDDKDNNDVPF